MSPAALIGGFVHLFDLYCISICVWICLPAWLRSVSLRFHLSSFVALRSQAWLLFSPLSAFVCLLSQLLWWRMGFWSSLFAITFVLHFSELVSSGAWCPSSFGICLPFVWGLVHSVSGLRWCKSWFPFLFLSHFHQPGPLPIA